MTAIQRTNQLCECQIENCYLWLQKKNGNADKKGSTRSRLSCFEIRWLFFWSVAQDCLNSGQLNSNYKKIRVTPMEWNN